MNLKGRDFLKLLDFTPEEITALLDLAAELKEKKAKTTAKTIAFFVVFFSAYIIHYAINSPKINWFMSLVDDKKRGRFTANKEIVSLAGGMIFSYLMGSIMDYFKYQNNIKMAFVVGATTILTFTVLHTLTLILSKEKPVEEDFKPLPLKKTFKNLILTSFSQYTTICFVSLFLYSVFNEHCELFVRWWR